MAPLGIGLSQRIGRRLKPVLVVVASAALSGCASLPSGGDVLQSVTAPFSAASREQTASAGEPKPTALNAAIRHWAEAFAKDPNNAEAALNYGRNLVASGDRKRAMAVFVAGLRASPDDQALLSEAGRLAADSNDLALAERFLSAADQPGRADWRVVSARGVVAAKLGDLAKASQLLSRARVLAPDEPAVLNNLALVRFAEGQPAEAEALLERAATLAKAPGRVGQNLAMMRGLQGRPADAGAVGPAAQSGAGAEITGSIAAHGWIVEAVPAATRSAADAGKAADPIRATANAPIALRPGR